MNQAARSASPSPRPPRGGRRLASFELASVPGSERLALARVAESVAAFNLPPGRLEKLKTAVAEATMNAIEHGNGNRCELMVDIEVFLAGGDIIVTVTDHGGGGGGPEPDPDAPDLARKLSGEQGPRGWGLFLIRHMVDRLDVTTDGQRRTVWLTMRTGQASATGTTGGGPG